MRFSSVIEYRHYLMVEEADCSIVVILIVLTELLIITGTIGVISMIVLALKKDLYLGFALLLLTCGSTGAAVGDVTIDACVTENSIAHPSLAGEMQSLCALCNSVGQIIGYISSGFLIHRIGSKVCCYHSTITIFTLLKDFCCIVLYWEVLLIIHYGDYGF